MQAKIKIFLLGVILTIIIFSSCKREIFNLPNSQPNLDTLASTLKIFPINNRISFSGYEWIVSNSPNKRVAPGNNFWSDTSVWVDGNGYLHLILKLDTATNKWFCAEIKSENKFGNGTYQFWINGRIDQLDKNVVFGLFNYSGVDFYDEIDIEFAKWGNDTNQNLNYTVYPATGTNGKILGSSTALLMDNSYSTHLYRRSTSSVIFESIYNFKGAKTYTKKINSTTISQKEMPIYINLWSFKSQPPSNQKEVEIIIQKFVYIN